MKKFSLEELAQYTSSTLIGNGLTTISGVNTLEKAIEDEVSFLANPLYVDAMKSSRAGVICIDASKFPLDPKKNYLVSEDPSRTFQQIAELIFSSQKPTSAFTGIHPTAIIHESAVIGKNVTVAPYVVIDQGVTIGDRTILHPFVSIGPKVSIGEDCIFHASSLVREGCTIGNRVILQPGAVIGSCGFGYTTTSSGTHQKLEQLGTVIIGDDVEIGANATVDRSRFSVTEIRKGSKLDNLVHVAHNVTIGENNLIAAQTGIAGSSSTGNNVVLGGQVGITGHVDLGDQVMVATRGGVSKSLPKKGKYRGSPAIPLGEYNRQEVHVRRLSLYLKTIQNLEKRVEELEEKLHKLTQATYD